MWAVVKTHTGVRGIADESFGVTVDAYSDKDKACCAMREMFCDSVKEMGDNLEYCNLCYRNLDTPLVARVFGLTEAFVFAVKRIP